MRAGELAVRAAPLGPHLVGEAKGVLQPLEPILQRGEVEAEALRLEDVPRRPDPEPRASARQDVEGGRGLDPQPRCPVVDPADHQAESRAFGVGRDEAERRLPLEHRRLGRAEASDLEEVVHDPDRVEAGVVRGARHARERGADGLRAAGPGELVDLEPELHAHMLPRNRSGWLIGRGAGAPRPHRSRPGEPPYPAASRTGRRRTRPCRSDRGRRG